MCAAAAIGPAIGAIGSAVSMSRNNQERRQNYQQQLKVRERNWMQTRTTYGTKIVQFEQEVDQANIAAQRAYSRTQIQLNNARSLAILENQEDFKKMLSGEGQIEASAAERGVRGKSVARQLVMNNAKFGMSQAMRSRGLAMAGYQAEESNLNVNRQLKGQLNRSFSRVAIQPIADIAPPQPVMENPGMALMLGFAEAGLTGLAANENLRKKIFSKKDKSDSSSGGGDSKANTGDVPGEFGDGTYGSGMPSRPDYRGSGANINYFY